MKPSEEQQLVVDLVTNGKSVIVNAVAGSGKTTTCLHIADQNPNKEILLLTYNKRLETETKKRNTHNNMDVFTFHGFCYRKYTGYGKDDEMLIDAIRMVDIEHDCGYDILIVDEVQDMRPILYQFLLRVINDYKPSQIVLLGDEKQCIYQYAGSDSRYLTLGNKLYEGDWTSTNLSTSYRLSTNIGDFINDCVIGCPKITTIKKVEKKVSYITCDTFRYHENHPLIKEIDSLLKEYSHTDIFILAAKVRSTWLIDKNDEVKKNITPLACLTNYLSEKGINIFVPESESDVINKDLMTNKLCCLSFHQSKGLENKVVIVFGFDQSYFKYFSHDTKDQTICPNTLYVAMTRAREKLILVSDKNNHPFKFLNLKKMRETITVTGKHNSSVVNTGNQRITLKLESVTGFVKSIKTEYIKAIRDCYSVIVTNVDDNVDIYINNLTSQKTTKEDVSGINGLAFPLYYEYVTTGGSSLLPIEEFQGTVVSYLKALVSYEAERSGYDHKKRQISSYSWLDKKGVKLTDSTLFKAVIARMKLVIEEVSTFEHQVLWQVSDNLVLRGFIDILSENYLFEIKTTSELSMEHICQVLVYYMLYRQMCPSSNVVPKLFNIKTGDIMTFTYVNEEKLMKLLLENYKSFNVEVNDDEFIQACNQYKIN